MVSKGLFQSSSFRLTLTDTSRYPERIGLRSTDQVVFTERSEIFKLISQLESDNREADDAFSFQTFSTVYDPLYEHCLLVEAATANRGDQLLLAEEEKARDLHWDGTGLEGLDEVLHGFSGTGIIEMTGKSDVGKTVRRLSRRHMRQSDLVITSSCRFISSCVTYRRIRP